MKKLDEAYTPTTFQNTIGRSLASEQLTGNLLPRVLSRVDMLIIFVAILLSFPTASVGSTLQEIGVVGYLYWIIGTATFLIPGAIVTGQLNRFMPVDGSIYVWTHRAFGPLLGFFAGFCAWFSGVLALFIISETAISFIQDIGAQLSSLQTNWLTAPWQQGLLVLAILALVAWLSRLPLRFVMQPIRIMILLYILVYLLIGLAGIIWLLSSHTAQTASPTSHLGSGIVGIVAPYALVVLALLGVEVPLNLAAETGQPNASTFALRWGPLLVMVASILGTFGFQVVVPAHSASTYVEAIHIVFGTPTAVLVDSILFVSSVFICLAFNITFARILFVAALDRRLPTVLARVNRHASPSNATTAQAAAVVFLAIITYLIGPLLYSKEGINFSFTVYSVTAGAIEIIWCLSMIFLFLDLPILLRRFRTLFITQPALLIAPPWLLYLCCAMGSIGSLVGIIASLSVSLNSGLIPNNQWWMVVGSVVLILLFIGLLGSAYPRLLSSLNEQTAVARENARLYSELSTAYAKLRELDQLKDAFLITAGHELRTPLTIVQGYLELLGEMPDASFAMQQDFLNKARRACDELVLLQANIMDASRIQFDTASLNYSALPLKEICTTVINLFEPLILQENRVVEVNIGAQIVVYADESRLKQVFHNLITNALRYSPQGTPVRITAVEEQKQGRVRINVIDRGFGVPPAKQEAIFERFVRLERDMHGTNRGSGLGLSIVRQLIEAMHGTITVESSGVEGEGSTFSFTLPTTL